MIRNKFFYSKRKQCLLKLRKALTNAVYGSVQQIQDIWASTTYQLQVKAISQHFMTRFLVRSLTNNKVSLLFIEIFFGLSNNKCWVQGRKKWSFLDHISKQRCLSISNKGSIMTVYKVIAMFFYHCATVIGETWTFCKW